LNDWNLWNDWNYWNQKFMFYLIQLLNAVQYGLLLFLLASGLTLIFGIMGVINLAHGSFYMIGAYLAYWLAKQTGSLWWAIPIGVVITLGIGLLLETAVIRRLYKRDHLYQVLLTFGLILVFEELRSILFGDDVHGVAIPSALNYSIPLTDTLSYPVYRLFVTAVCLVIAGLLYLVIYKTRVGMMIRAGNSNREMAASLGVNVPLLFAGVFAVGMALAGLAGAIAAPISSVFPGMGNQILIICFVVVVIGGIGSINGALIASLAIGIADTAGKVIAAEYSAIAVYLVMALILLWRPQGIANRA
jgi:branched-chain amino acid transport system permease protein